MADITIVEAHGLFPQPKEAAPVIVPYPEDEPINEKSHSIWLVLNRCGLISDIVMTFMCFEGAPRLGQVERWVELNAQNHLFRESAVLIDTGIRVDGSRGFVKWLDDHSAPDGPIRYIIMNSVFIPGRLL